MIEIVVIGTGYVGLVTGASFASMGHRVTCLDIDQKKIELLKQGIIPFYEPQLSELVAMTTKSELLFFTTDYQEALKGADVVFLALPTPSKADGACDLSYMEKAAEEIAVQMKKKLLVVNKSTVPCGTAKHIHLILTNKLKELKKDLEVEVISNPEFLKEGSAVQDSLKPDRIVIGVESKHAEELMRKIYSPFHLNHERMIVMDVASAEMTKYAANCMLASRISMMNEFSRICELTGADIHKVRLGIGSDSRIGNQFIYAGIGYGGSCFPKDVRALSKTAELLGLNTPLLKAIEEVNEAQKEVLGNKIEHYFKSLEGKTIAIWGLSFKPDTDDMREAPSLVLIRKLLEKKARLRLFDPIAMDKAKSLLPTTELISFATSPFEAAKGADAIALITEWKIFRRLDLENVKAQMKGKAFFDGRNQYDPQEMKTLGFDYFCIGRPS